MKKTIDELIKEFNSDITKLMFILEEPDETIKQRDYMDFQKEINEAMILYRQIDILLANEDEKYQTDVDQSIKSIDMILENLTNRSFQL